MNAERERPLYVDIRVRGGLGSEWSGWLAGLRVLAEPDGNTLFAGPLPDQAALHGILARLRDMGLPIISVNVTSRDKEESSECE